MEQQSSNLGIDLSLLCRKPGDELLSPTKLIQRERNRQAVRKFRKRKKEQTLYLEERYVQLTDINRRLKKELGSRNIRSGASLSEPNEKNEEDNVDVEAIGNHDKRDVVQEIVSILKEVQAETTESNSGMDSSISSGTSQSAIALQRLIREYIERYHDHGSNRRNSMRYLLSRTQQLVIPDVVTSGFLLLMTSANSDRKELKEISEQLVKYLNLSPEQQNELRKHRKYASTLRTELENTIAKLNILVGQCHQNKKLVDSLTGLINTLQDEQFALYIAWVEKNPVCKEILDDLWTSFSGKWDMVIDNEISRNSSHLHEIRHLRENSAIFALRLFSMTDNDSRVSLAKSCMHPNIGLTDANNDAFQRGLNSAVDYIKRVSDTFDVQVNDNGGCRRLLDVQEKSLVYDQQEDKVTGSWTFSGVVVVNFLPSLPKDVVKDDASNMKSCQEIVSDTRSDELHRRVAFEVMIEFSFADSLKPELITDIVISWNAVSLLHQLGLLKFPAGQPIE